MMSVSELFQRVYEIVACIPRGKVVTCGSLCHCELLYGAFVPLVRAETLTVIARRRFSAEAIPKLLIGDCFAFGSQ